MQTDGRPCIFCGAKATAQIVSVTFDVQGEEDPDLPPVLANGYHCESCEGEFLTTEQEVALVETLDLEAYELLYIEEV